MAQKRLAMLKIKASIRRISLLWRDDCEEPVRELAAVVIERVMNEPIEPVERV